MSSQPSPSADETSIGAALERLVALVARLRGEGGCPWDRAQTHHSLLPFTIEEAYEVVEAVESGNLTELKKELGDLAFHVVLYSRIAQEGGHFDLKEVLERVVSKMVHRHPHVFGEERLESPDAVVKAWHALKEAERAKTAREEGKTPEKSSPAGLFAGLTGQMPALLWAYKSQQKMAHVGLDWPDLSGVVDKVEEELAELKEVATHPDAAAAREEEVGDLLFAVVNLARHLGVNPETALRQATLKVQDRSMRIGRRLESEHRSWKGLSLDELDQLWLWAKRVSSENAS
ncbi:MAG: nucleoside triphosphate pyrophosphohydrolase [Magnetococcales bacterium]|nr:nucleoside triphosphate pyrophosphohydrolase [Magnetococcales bacterium]